MAAAASSTKKMEQDLRSAVEDGDEDKVKTLVVKGVNIDAADDDLGYTALHLAVLRRNAGIVDRLISEGANIESQLVTGETALDIAKRWNKTECVVLLEKAAAQKQELILRNAVRKGDVHVVEWMVGAGVVNIEAPCPQFGTTPLHEAVSRGHDEVARLLLHGGANIEGTDDNNNTALHKAAAGGHDTTVTLLLNNGADLEAVDNQKDTALHNAAYYGKHYVVVPLLKAGANLDAVDKDGKTPLDWAKQQKWTACVNLLEEAKAVRKNAALKVQRKWRQHKLKKGAQQAARRQAARHRVMALILLGLTLWVCRAFSFGIALNCTTRQRNNFNKQLGMLVKAQVGFEPVDTLTRCSLGTGNDSTAPTCLLLPAPAEQGDVTQIVEYHFNHARAQRQKDLSQRAASYWADFESDARSSSDVGSAMIAARGWFNDWLYKQEERAMAEAKEQLAALGVEPTGLDHAIEEARAGYDFWLEWTDRMNAHEKGMYLQKTDVENERSRTQRKRNAAGRLGAGLDGLLSTAVPFALSCLAAVRGSEKRPEQEGRWWNNVGKWLIGPFRIGVRWTVGNTIRPLLGDANQASGLLAFMAATLGPYFLVAVLMMPSVITLGAKWFELVPALVIVSLRIGLSYVFGFLLAGVGRNFFDPFEFGGPLRNFNLFDHFEFGGPLRRLVEWVRAHTTIVCVLIFVYLGVVRGALFLCAI